MTMFRNSLAWGVHYLILWVFVTYVFAIPILPPWLAGLAFSIIGRYYTTPEHTPSFSFKISALIAMLTGISLYGHNIYTSAVSGNWLSLVFSALNLILVFFFDSKLIQLNMND